MRSTVRYDPESGRHTNLALAAACLAVVVSWAVLGPAPIEAPESSDSAGPVLAGSSEREPTPTNAPLLPRTAAEVGVAAPGAEHGSITVVDRSGAPVPHAYACRLDGRGRITEHTTADALGRIEMPRGWEGEVLVVDERHCARRVDLRAGGEVDVIELDELAHVTGDVIGIPDHVRATCRSQVYVRCSSPGGRDLVAIATYSELARLAQSTHDLEGAAFSFPFRFQGDAVIGVRIVSRATGRTVRQREMPVTARDLQLGKPVLIHFDLDDLRGLKKLIATLSAEPAYAGECVLQLAGPQRGLLPIRDYGAAGSAVLDAHKASACFEWRDVELGTYVPVVICPGVGSYRLEDFAFVGQDGAEFVLRRKRVVFRLTRPAAHEVSIRASDAGWWSDVRVTLDGRDSVELDLGHGRYWVTGTCASAELASPIAWFDVGDATTPEVTLELVASATVRFRRSVPEATDVAPYHVSFRDELRGLDWPGRWVGRPSFECVVPQGRYSVRSVVGGTSTDLGTFDVSRGGVTVDVR